MLGPGAQLFCLLSDMEDPAQNEIIDLDAQTLQLRHRFGRSHLNSVGGMAVVGEELFVCDTWNDRLRVFSSRAVPPLDHGRVGSAETLCFLKDRLYRRMAGDEEDEEGELFPASGPAYLRAVLAGRDPADAVPRPRGAAALHQRPSLLLRQCWRVRDMVQEVDDTGFSVPACGGSLAGA